MTMDPHEAGASLRAAMAEMGSPDPSMPPLALGWATVELGRAERAFTEAFASSIGGAEDAPDDILLGARCRLIRTGAPGVPMVILLEPFTEGRLAASLARHGEGPAAIWVRADPLQVVTAAAAGRPEPAVRRSIAAPGPFGTEVLLLDGPPSGPHRLLVLAEPGTITP